MNGAAKWQRPPLVLEEGASAEILETDGNWVALRSSVPSPPGSTLQGLLGGEGRPIRVKVRTCKRVEEGPLRFRIEGRFVDLTRGQREAVAPPRSGD